MECTPPRVNPHGNYGFWVMMCQCRLISCNKWTTLAQDVDDVGGGYECVRAGS